MIILQWREMIVGNSFKFKNTKLTLKSPYPFNVKYLLVSKFPKMMIFHEILMNNLKIIKVFLGTVYITFIYYCNFYN